MEICQANYDVLKNDLLDLRELLVRTKTKEEKSHCLSSIYSLNLLCNSLNAAGSNYLDELIKKNKNKYFDSLSFSRKHKDLYAHNFVQNKEKLREILYRYICVYEEEIQKYDCNFNFNDIIFSKKDAKLILYDFFERCHSEDLAYVDRLINKKRILNVDSVGLYQGTCFNIYKKEPIILVQGNGRSILSLVSIIHECAHAKDFKNLSDNYSVNAAEKYYYHSDYIEFLSRLYEKQALEYFYDFHFDDNHVLSLLADYHFTTYCNLVKTYILSLFPNSILEKNSYLKYDKEYLKLLIPIDEYDASFDKFIHANDLDLKESCTYAISSLLAAVCDSKIKDNSSDVKHLYDNIMANRFDLFKPDIFKDLNLTDDDIEKMFKKRN